MQTQECLNYICDWMKDYLNQSQSKGFVVGISGGIDSALTSTLAAKTELNVLCIEMPINQNPDQLSRSQEHIKWLESRYKNVQSIRVDLSDLYAKFVQTVGSSNKSENHTISLVNSRARLRMTTLYYYAQLHGYLVLGTGNKVEDFGIGFYTKYGDGGVDLSPIADLLKTEVYALAKELGVVSSIQSAAPTDGLWNDNRTDEDQIGASYPELEWAMNYKGNKSLLTERQIKVLEIYSRLNNSNKHKMIPIPLCKIPDHLKL